LGDGVESSGGFGFWHDLDSVAKFDTVDDFRHLVLTLQTEMVIPLEDFPVVPGSSWWGDFGARQGKRRKSISTSGGKTRAHFQFLDKVTTGKGREAEGRRSPSNPGQKSARRGGSAGASNQ
jgi:hypothetical protein